MDSTGASHRRWLATMTYVVENFLCLVQSRIIAVPLPLVYKSSTMVPSKIHHHFQSRVLYSPSLAVPTVILRTFIHSLLRCSPSPLPLPSSSLL